MRHRRPTDPVDRMAAVVHVVTLVAGFAFVLFENRRQWFVDDDFEFLTRRGLGHAHWGLFTPHNEHWVTIPILLYRALYSAFGLHHHLAYVVPMALMHVLAAHMVWRLSRRAGVDPWLATGFVAVFLVLGAGSENLLWSFQVSFVGSLALGLVFIELVDHDGAFGGRDLAAVLIAVVALMFSGITVTMVATAAIVVWLRRGWRTAAAFAAGPAVIYVIWFALAGSRGLQSSYEPTDPLLDVPKFVWSGLTATLSASSGLDGAGAVLVLALFVGLLRWKGGIGPKMAAPVGMALGAVLMFVVTSTGRSGLGTDSATAPRYIYIAIALLLPAIGCLLTALTERVAYRTIAILAVVALAGMHNVGLMRDAAKERAQRAQSLKQSLLATAQIIRSTTQLAGAPQTLVLAPDLDGRTIAALDRDGALPAAGKIGPLEELRAEAAVLTSLTHTPTYLSTAVSLADAPRAAVVPDPNAAGCMLATPAGEEAQLVLHHGQPVSLQLRPDVSGTLKVFLLGDGGLVTDPKPYPVLAGATVWVDEGRPEGNFLLTIPAGGTTQICNVTDRRG
jgi:hypothetical protein